MSGGGHRRISTDLFLENVPRKRPYTVIEALLSIDMDVNRGGLKSISAYSRIFDRSRNWCRARLNEYHDKRASLKNDGQFLDSLGTVCGQSLDTQDGRDTKGKEGTKDSSWTLHGQFVDSLGTPTLIRSEQDPEEEKKKEPAADAALSLFPGGNGKPKPEKRPEKKARKTAFPEPFPLDDLDRLYSWAPGAGFTRAQVDQSLMRIGDWAVSNDKAMASWVRAVQGYMRDGWPLRQQSTETPEQRYARMAREMEEEERASR